MESVHLHCVTRCQTYDHRTNDMDLLDPLVEWKRLPTSTQRQNVSLSN